MSHEDLITLTIVGGLVLIAIALLWGVERFRRRQARKAMERASAEMDEMLDALEEGRWQRWQGMSVGTQVKNHDLHLMEINSHNARQVFPIPLAEVADSCFSCGAPLPFYGAAVRCPECNTPIYRKTF